MDSSLHDGAGPTAPGTVAVPRPSLLRACLWALCGAGCGLVLWVALSSVLLMDSVGMLRELADLQTWGLALGVALASTGLGLFWPKPPAPAPGHWWGRGLAALLVVVAAGATLALLLRQPAPDPTVRALMAALATVAALAMIAARVLLEGGAIDRRLPARLALALLGGAVLLFVLIARHWPGPMPATGPIPALALLALAATALVVAQWWPEGGLQPWRRWRGRWLVLVLIAALPLLLAGLLQLRPGWAFVVWPLVALSVLAGSALERLQDR